MPDGPWSDYQGADLPVGARQNNPGNLRGPDGEFQSYPDVPTGVADNVRQLVYNQDQHGVSTVRDQVTRWVSDPRADLRSYISDVARGVGVSPDQPVDFHNPQVAERYIMAMQPHESGPYPLNPEHVREGVNMVLGQAQAPPWQQYQQGQPSGPWSDYQQTQQTNTLGVRLPGGGPMPQDEGLPLTSREALQQLPMAKTEAEAPLPPIQRQETPEQPGMLGRIGEAAREGYASAPPLIDPQSSTGKWLTAHGMEGLTMPFAPMGALNAAWQAATTGTYEGVKAAGGSEQSARDAAGYVESAGMTGAPHVPLMESLRGAAEAKQAATAPGEAPAPPPQPAEASLQKMAAGQPAPEAVTNLEQMAAQPQTPEALAAAEEMPTVTVTAKRPEPPPEEAAPAPRAPAAPVAEEPPAAQAEPTPQVPPAEAPKEEPAPQPTPEPAPEAAPETAGKTPKPETPFVPVPKAPTRLIEFLRRPQVVGRGTMQETTIPGGLQDTGGDLKAVLGGTRGRPGLINNKAGRTLDDAAENAWEAGYFPDHPERPSVNDLLDAIRDDHTGTPRYSEQDQDRVDAFHQAIEHNAEIDRLGSEYGIPTTGINHAAFYDQLHDAMSVGERAREIASQDAANLAAQREFEKGAKDWHEQHPETGVAPSPWNARDFYGQSQFRGLDDLEREYQQETAATEQGEHAGRAAETGPPGEPAGAGEEGAGPREPGTGPPGRAEAEGPATDLLGNPLAAPRERATPEPTIRNDPRQIGLIGTEPSAVQAQAARDAGRGTLRGEGPQQEPGGMFEHRPEGQGTLYSFPGPIVQSLADEAGRAIGALGRGAEEAKAGLAPTSISRAAKGVEYRIRREITGPSARAYDQAMFRIDDARREVNKLSQADQEETAYRFETGQPQATPELQKAADALRKLTDEWTAKVQSLGRGYLKNAIDNYLGHIWSNYSPSLFANQATLAGRIAAVARRQPLRGPGTFLKQRTYPTQREGIAAGLIPTTWNWVDTQMVKIHEMQKFFYGQKFADAMKADGIARWVPAADEFEAERNGMVKLNDRVFQPKIYGAGQAGPMIPGAYYAPADAARIFNNYMSSGISQSLLYKGANRANQALNALQLGVSGFHASFVVADTAISKLALGMQQIARGEIGRGVGNALFGQTVIPAAAQTFWKGRQVLNAWKDPANATPASRMIADAYERVGGRATMPDFFRANASGSFFKTIGDLKNPMSVGYEAWQMFKDAQGPIEKALVVPFKIAMRTIDTMQQPLMGYLVPRMKAGVFADLSQDWLRRNPNATLDQLSEAMTKIQDSVDNRLGQLNYDNLFWNKTLKDLAFISMRSVGWNLGTVREIGGGFVDAAGALKGMAQLKAPKLTTRMAYTMALPVITAEIGSLLTYLSTGQGPQSDPKSDLASVLPLDYFYPPTGTVDASGVAERRSMPGYMKDVVAFSRDPQQTVLNKTSPMLESLNELRTNRDYYGGIIYDPERDSMLPAYGDFLLNQMTPFSLRAMGRLEGQKASRLDQALGFFGFQPAPQSITHPEISQHFQELEEKKAYKRREKEVAKGNYTHVLGGPPTPTNAP